MSVLAIIAPIAKDVKHLPRGQSDVPEMMRAGLVMLFHSGGIIANLCVVGIIRMLMAAGAAVILAGLLAVEIACFPVLLGAQVSLKRPTEKMFALISWLAAVTGIAITLALAVVAYKE